MPTKYNIVVLSGNTNRLHYFILYLNKTTGILLDKHQKSIYQYWPGVMSFTVLNNGRISLSQQWHGTEQKFHKCIRGYIPEIIVKKDALDTWKATETAV